VATYTPALDFNGTDTFTYKANDGLADSNVATVTITVTPVNDAPVANEDSYTTYEDVQKFVPADFGVLANDTDPDGDILTVVLVGTPETAHGYIALVQDGSFMYTPNPDFYGEDSFIYKAYDGTYYSAEVTVTITVTPVNDAPVAVEDAYTTDEDTILTVLAPGILENDSDADGDEMTIFPVDDVSFGTLDWTLNGGFIYTPDSEFNGIDTFSYKLTDGEADSDTVVVTITVNPVNDYVTANDDEYETMAGVTLDVAAPGVLENDVLLDPNETVTLEVIADPAGGTLTLNDDGSFTYVPNAGFIGVDTFEYQLNSTVMLNGEFSDTALVTIKVTPKQIFLPLILR
jgi:VCBS repeat-containing protein